GELVGLPLGPPRVLRTDDLPAAGPGRLAGSADRRAVDRQHVDIGRALGLLTGDRDVLADDRRERVRVAPPPWGSGLELVHGGANGEDEFAVLAARRIHDPAQ